MASVRRAAGTVKEGAELAAALVLSQPRVTGTGSSQKFDNPWPEWQVCLRTALLPVRLRYMPCLGARWQERSSTDVIGWAWKRRGLAPATGSLLKHPKPTPADFQRAFPVSPPNYAAMATPPGEAPKRLCWSAVYAGWPACNAGQC